MITWCSPDDFNKLHASTSLRKVAELSKSVALLTASTAALEKSCAAIDAKFAEAFALAKRVEVNQAAVERDVLAAERIHAAVFADRPFGPDDLAKALVERGARFFMN
jgi:flagellar biosynthesis regulator FlaF